jgi:peptidoglycan/LPS O-acetylase OafA/YrhL
MSARFASVDALRGFAALWVFAYHLWNFYCPYCSAQVEPIPFDRLTSPAVVATYPVFAYGYAGVGLFFVLSGFCIHLPQARRFHATGRDALDVREFGRRRFWRLYPAFLASLFLASLGLAAMKVTWEEPPGSTWYTFDALAKAFGLSWILPNAVFALPLAPSAQLLNPVAWTLLYEVQFYLLYPLLLKVVRRVGFGPVAGVLLGCELAFALVPTPTVLEPLSPHFTYFFLRRYFDWFLGMWLAERLMAGRPLSATWGKRLFAVGLVGGPLASAFAVSWPLHEVLLVVGSTGLVGWVVATPDAPPNRVTRALAPVGEWSYSLYLVHMSVMRLVVAGYQVLLDEWKGGWTLAGAGVACVVVVPLTAWVWYRLFEKPYLPKAATVRPPHEKGPGGAVDVSAPHHPSFV